jgi:Phosphate-selective porin O and P
MTSRFRSQSARIAKASAVATLLTASLHAGSATAAAAADATASATTQQQEIELLMQQLNALQKQMQQLAQQNQQMLQRQQQLEQQLAGTTTPASDGSVASTAGGATATPSPVPPANPVPPAGGSAPVASNSLLGALHLWGYGELYYTHPVHDNTASQFDLARGVFGIGYTFNSRTEFNSEFEVEHAVSSADDVGEFEVEQFYIDRQLYDWASLRAGLFLMPFGFLNEHHEPTNFYGVQRNFVETLIIPSTWREGGLNLHGDTPFGLNWSAGLTTGFDLAKWNFAPENPLYSTALDLEDSDSAPLQATHQEAALATAQHLSEFISLNYYGVPGLDVGAALFTGDAGKVPAPPNAAIPGNERVTLWEGHARWTPGPFDLSALYARGAISNTAIANSSNPGTPNPIPSRFYGYYFQGAYTLWDQGEYRLAPFARYEYYDMGSRYEGVPGPVLPTGSVPLGDAPGVYGPWPVGRDRVWTFGANFYVTPHVVFKADYQHFDYNDFSRFDLGLGLAF